MITAPKQLALAIGLTEPPSLDNFYAAQHEPVVALLRQFASGDGEQYLYLWGKKGCGVSHLLVGVVEAAHYHGIASAYLSLADAIEYPTSVLFELDDVELVALDDLDAALGNDEWEEALFHLFNRLRDSGKRLIIGSHHHPFKEAVNLPDLRSRLAWGLALQIEELDDKGKEEALVAGAKARGLALSNEAAHYIVVRSGREIGELMAVLDMLDDASLAQQRKLTVPFIKAFMNW